MTRYAAAAALLLALHALLGCAAQPSAASTLAAYLAAAAAEAAYIEEPGADPTIVAIIRNCDIAAFIVVQRVAQEQAPTQDELQAASSAVAALNACLLSHGVSPT